jgi:hypothetical protein
VTSIVIGADATQRNLSSDVMNTAEQPEDQ